VVEGQTRRRRNQDPLKHSIRIIEKVERWNPQRLDPRRSKPFIASRVTAGPITTRMRFSVDFNRQPCVATEEVQNVRTGRMLAAELEAFRPLPKPTPQDNFRQSHLAAEAARIACRPRTRFRCDVL
jgi:hypothetical protein